ncbi:MAG: hypothetical protein HYZ28_23390 [Myxococcales bacterium]|nr:hypothetical protein [Myxococcales bacterium]
MRRIVLLLLVTACCVPAGEPVIPPQGTLYFPAGVVHLDSPDSPEGFLYVASVNTDRRYDFGSVTAIELSNVGSPDTGLPAIGATPNGGPLLIPELNVADRGVAAIDSFAGEMAAFRPPDGGSPLLFVPTRSERSRLNVILASGPLLSCFGDGQGQNCSASAASLVAFEKTASDGGANPSGLPRAPEPFGVGISRDGQGEVFVTHLESADSPPGSRGNFKTYLVKTSAGNPTITEQSFIGLGGGGTHSVEVGARYAYVTGRFLNPFGHLLRLVDRQTEEVLFTSLEDVFRAREARGIALGSNERRLYMVAREPDELLVVELEAITTASPTVRIVRHVPLPRGPNQARVIERAGRGDLVVVSCSTAGVVAIYDDDAGVLVSQLSGVGAQPFGLAVSRRGAGARLFVTNFGDGRVAVIDLPDVSRPDQARLVAHLGKPHVCHTSPDDPECTKGAQ